MGKEAGMYRDNDRNNMRESQNHDAEGKKPNQDEYALSFHLQDVLENADSPTATER